MDLAKRLSIQVPSPLEPLQVQWAEGSDAKLWVKRDDLLHPVISGNKWRKLEFALADFLKHDYDTIVSFGGGYSNHLHALGYCCNKLNIPFQAMIRGNYSKQPPPMLQDLSEWAGNLHWLAKVDYKKRYEPEFLQSIHNKFPNAYLIPEGGSQVHAKQGLAKLLQELPREIDTLVCPVASGGTLAGLIASSKQLNRPINLIGIAVLKGDGYLEGLVNDLLVQMQTDSTGVEWHIEHGFHCGGYAKSNRELLSFCQAFQKTSDVPVEPVYSGKLFYGVEQLLKAGFFSASGNIALLHTGGLQGAR